MSEERTSTLSRFATGHVEPIVERSQRILPVIDLEEDVYTLALERARYALARFDHITVSFSGGKDSTACLHVMLDAIHADEARYGKHLPLDVFFLDEEGISLETEAYVRRIGQRDDVALRWFCIPMWNLNACSAKDGHWWPWDPEKRDKWVRPMPPEAISELPGMVIWPKEKRPTMPDINGLVCPPELGNVGLVMGIRAEESPIRRAACRRKAPGEPNYVKRISKDDCSTSQGNLWKVYPIYDWTTEDVWTGPRIFGWDYNETYDLLEMMGLTHFSQRISAPFGEIPIQKLRMFSECFPDVWAGMSERVEGAGCAIRYSETELYGFRGHPVKPTGMRWPEFIMHYAQQHSMKRQRSTSTDASHYEQILDRVQNEIRNHYRQTSHPIPAKHFHPDTGLSWDFLLHIAIRGDYHARTQTKVKVAGGNGPDGRPTVETWRRYAAEIQRSLDEETFDELAHPGRVPASGMALLPAYAREEETTDD